MKPKLAKHTFEAEPKCEGKQMAGCLTTMADSRGTSADDLMLGQACYGTRFY